MSTKQEIYDKFYNLLTDEEREAGAEALPDYVKYLEINKTPLPLTEDQRKWANEVVSRLVKGD